MSSLRLLISDSYGPWFNLAVEECIFRQMSPDQRVLFCGETPIPWLLAAPRILGKSAILGVWSKMA